MRALSTPSAASSTGADHAFGSLLAELRLTQRAQEKALSEQATKLSDQVAKLADVSAAAEIRHVTTTPYSGTCISQCRSGS